MRIRKDKTSWHARGVVKRDWKQDKSVDGPVRPVAKKKDTKTWCRGKEGRRHEFEWQPTKWRYRQARDMVCKRCQIRPVTSENWDDWKKDPNELYYADRPYWKVHNEWQQAQREAARKEHGTCKCGYWLHGAERCAKCGGVSKYDF
jgi:hypothetical protein